MIGQSKLLTTLSTQAKNEVYPRFSILVGNKGSGRKTVANVIPTFFKGTDYTYTLPDVKVDTIREMIGKAYKVNTRTFYIIPDADTMSPAAKNALLKVTEEPPNNAYFIMTLESLSNTLDTIKSRATVFNMDLYSGKEILEYAKQKTNYTLHSDETEVIIDICETPGEVDILLNDGIHNFYEYVEKVVDNIAEVSGSNAFKVADKVSFKAENEEGKYDLRLFWKAFMKVCMSRLSTDPIRYAHGVKTTSKYLQELRSVSINKQMAFDMWILHIREEWM